MSRLKGVIGVFVCAALAACTTLQDDEPEIREFVRPA